MTDLWRGSIVPLLALLLATAVLPASPARAYESQWTLGVGAGYGAVLVDSVLPHHGLPLTGVDVSFGLDDTWVLQVHTGYAYHPALAMGETPLHLMIAGVEVLYIFDILEVVPLLGLGIDLLPQLFDDQWGVDFAAHLLLGLDWLLSREVAVGLDIRPYFLLTSLSLNPVYLSVNLRVSFLFDY